MMNSVITNFSGINSFMLNSSMSKIVVKGIVFRNVETLYYASLASTDEDRVRFSKMSAFDARTLAQNMGLENNFTAEERIAKMRSCIRAKFTQPQNWDLALKLVNTGDRELVNGNTTGDTFWGVCGGQGENNLGKILMAYRDFFKTHPEYTRQRKENAPAAPTKQVQVPASAVVPAVAPKSEVVPAMPAAPSATTDRRKVVVTADGSCLGNPGFGGWAAIIREGSNKTILKGGDPDTTNNRMELLAVINAVKAFDELVWLTIRTDSEYVVRTLDELREIKERDFHGKTGKVLANADLLKELVSAFSAHHVRFKAEHVMGHAGDPDNEECDRLAKEQAKLFKKGCNTEESASNVDKEGFACID